MDIISELQEFLVAEGAIASGPDNKSFPPDEDLIAKGVIDSLGIMKLTAFIEQKFNVKVADEDIVPENFQNLNSFRDFIEKRYNQAGLSLRPLQMGHLQRFQEVCCTFEELPMAHSR